MTCPKGPTKYKEHVIIKTAREFEVMLVCDVRAPEPTENVLGVGEGEMTFFRDALKASLRWPLHPFFIYFLTSYFLYPG